MDLVKTNFMMADEYITMVRGDTLSFGLEVKDQDGGPINLSSAYFTCKQNYSDGVYVFLKRLGNGITKSEAGKYVVRLAPEDTKTVEPGRYFYDLQIGVAEDVYTVLKGVIEIQMDVTV